MRSKVNVDIIGQAVTPFKLAQPPIFAVLRDGEAPVTRFLTRPSRIGRFDYDDRAVEDEFVFIDANDAAFDRDMARAAHSALFAFKD